MSMPETPEAMRAFSVVLRWPVQWGDQDAYGHVNNTVYFRWFESARIAYLERLGQESMLRGGGHGPILAAIDCNYRQQLRYPDEVLIGATVARIGNRSLRMRNAVYSRAQDKLVADGVATIVMFDYRAQTSVRVSDELRSAIEHLESAVGRSVES